MSAKMYGAGRIAELPDKKIWVFESSAEADVIIKLGGVAVVPTEIDDYAALADRDVIVWARNTVDGVNWQFGALSAAYQHAEKVQFVSPNSPGIDGGDSIIEWAENQEDIRKSINFGLTIMTPPDHVLTDSPEVALDVAIQVRKKIYDPDWENKLAQTKGKLDANGNVLVEPKTKNTLGNLQLIVGNHPLWRDVLAYNERTLQETIVRRPPWNLDIEVPTQLVDEHAGEAVLWMQNEYDLYTSSSTMQEAMSIVAKKKPFDPVRDYFTSLEWDGKTRLWTWLHDYTGAPLTPYTQAVGTKYLISAVARTFRPGCQVDTMMILEGEQGIKKSSLFRALAMANESDQNDDNFTDQIGDLSKTDTLMCLHGPIFAEFSELDQMSKSEINTVKSFITSRVDRFRPPYGRTVRKYRRRCIFCGTTNEENYLKDATGGRRFWPVKIQRVDFSRLLKDRDQLWAEAVTRFNEGETWYMNGELELLAKQEQADRYQSDPWEPIVEEYLLDSATDMNRHDSAYDTKTGRRVFVTTKELLLKAINMQSERQEHRHAMRVGNIMRHALGWRKKKIRVAEECRTLNVYFQPDDFGARLEYDGEQEELEF